jgi:hypothetical protein
MFSDTYPYYGGTNAWDIGLGVAYSTAIGNFVWSDMSYSALHDTSSASLDWIDGYLIKTLGNGATFTLSRT